MGAVTPVAPYKPSNCTTQNGSDYKNTLDNNSVAAQRIVTRFAPHAASPANMTVLADPGSIFTGVTLIELAQQATPALVAPMNYPRIDRIVIDNITGVIAVVPGQESTTPAPPAIPNGKSPVAQVTLTVGMAAITNNAIADERNFGALSTGGFGAQAPIGSAASCDLGSVLSRNALITGTTTISGFGATANTQNPIYLVEFSGSLGLANGAALLLPGAVDIISAPGDTAVAEYLGAGNWRIRDYTRADGSSIDAFVGDTGTGGTRGLVPAPAAGDAAAGKVLRADGTWATSSAALVPLAFADAANSAMIDFTSLIDGTYDFYEFEFENIVPGTNGAALYALTSSDGINFTQAASAYNWSWAYYSGNGDGGSVSASSVLYISGIGMSNSNAYPPGNGRLRIRNPAGSTYKKSMTIEFDCVSSAPTNVGVRGQVSRNSTDPISAFRFFMSTGVIAAGRIILYGGKHQ